MHKIKLFLVNKYTCIISNVVLKDIQEIKNPDQQP
jgi:hypothetical protein